MSLYTLFYNNVISHSPEKIVEGMGGTFMKLSSWLAPKIIELPITIDNLKFKNPIGISSGWVDTPDKIKTMHKLGCGVVTVKTITVDERKGNPRPRLVRSKNQLINSMGLPNKGVDWWESNFSKDNSHPTILSIRGDNQMEWEELINKLENKTDVFELNFSCPNLHDGVMDLDSSKKAVMDVSSVTTKKIWLKISPEYTPNQNLDFINSVRDSIHGITAINTVPVYSEKLGNPQNKGGLSGDPIHDKLIDMLAIIRNHYSHSDLPIFAVGGINSPQRAWSVFTKYSAIPLALTAFLRQGPYFYHKVAKHFQKKLFESDYSSLQQFLD